MKMTPATFWLICEVALVGLLWFAFGFSHPLFWIISLVGTVVNTGLAIQATDRRYADMSRTEMPNLDRYMENRRAAESLRPLGGMYVPMKKPAAAPDSDIGRKLFLEDPI